MVLYDPMSFDETAAGYSATRIEMQRRRPTTGGGEQGGDERERWLRALLAADQRHRSRLAPEELLGRGLLRLRLYMGWSQKDVERVSQVDQSTLSRLETGKAANVGSARICAVLAALRVGDVVILP